MSDSWKAAKIRIILSARILGPKLIKGITMNLKRTLKGALRKIGLDVVKYPPLPQFVHHLRSFFRENDINIVLDVGAYHGKYCRLLRDDVGFSGSIVSFEPFSKSFEILSREMADDPRWTGFNFGLSNANTQAALNTHGDAGDFNSILQLCPAQASAYGVTSGKSETIQLKRLDEVWPDIAATIKNPRAFLKIDTQGHDVNVLSGALGCAQFILGLQSELPAIEIYEGMTSMPEMLRIFRESNYTPVGFYPVNRPATYGGAVPEFDAIFLRRTS